MHSEWIIGLKREFRVGTPIVRHSDRYFCWEHCVWRGSGNCEGNIVAMSFYGFPSLFRDLYPDLMDSRWITRQFLFYREIEEIVMEEVAKDSEW